MMQAPEKTSREPARRKGWCPGVLNPMHTGDGLLVRVKPRIGRLTCPQALAIARCAEQYGNGKLELTQRANINIRGLCEMTLALLSQTLRGHGLVDRTVDIEAVRNIVVSPLVAIGEDRALVEKIAAQLEAKLEDEPSLHALPNKFGFAINAGSIPNNLSTRADITLSYCADRRAWRVTLDGDETTAAYVTSEHVIDKAIAAAKTFLSNRDNKMRRMSHLCKKLPASDIFSQCGLNAEKVEAKPGVNHAHARQYLMGKRMSDTGQHYVSVGVPFGRTEAGQLSALIKSAQGAGISELYLSTQRSLLIPCASAEEQLFVANRAKRLGFITDEHDVRIAIVTCPGSSGCAHGLADTLADAEFLTTSLKDRGYQHDNLLIHISGCEKSCAHKGVADMTFTARENGYDLILNGKVGDSARTSNLSANECLDVVSEYQAPTPVAGKQA